MNEETNVVRLPLWKSCLDEMLKDGVHEGKVYASEYFEKWLRSKPGTIQFGTGVSNIREELEHRGLYLTGRGQKGAQFVIIARHTNVKQASSYMNGAMRCSKRAVILLSNTLLDGFTDTQRRIHEQILERAATRLALLHRSTAIGNFIKKNKPNLLNGHKVDPPPTPE